MITQITVSSQSVFEALVPRANTAVISITDPGEELNIQPGWGLVLQVAFIDGGYDESVIRSFGPSFPSAYSDYLEKTRARRIRRFIRTIADKATIETLHVHCKAGQSRSVAVATYAAKQYGLDIEIDRSKLNRSVLRLLNEPFYFDQVLQESGCCPTEETTSPDLWTGLKSAFTRVFGP